MKKIDFTQPGGFPLTQDTLRYMQEGYYEGIKAFIAYLGGEATQVGPGLNLIVDGLRELTTGIAGASSENPYITAGWIIRNGELMRFTGAFLQEINNAGGIGVEETAESVIFHDETTPAVYFNKKAVAGGANPLSLNLYVRAKPQTFYRDIYAFNFSRNLNGIAPGAQASFTFENNIITKEDVVMVQLKDPVQDSGKLLINAEVIQQGVVMITISNLNQADEMLGGLTAFKMRVIK